MITGRLAGRRVLVTGGSRGLGRAFCVRFAAHGAKVAFTYRRNDEAALQARAATAAVGAEALAFKVSVLDFDGTEKVVDELEKAWGGLDVLVNNAGVTQNLPIALMEEEDWDFVMDTNVKGAFLTTRAVLPGMMQRKAGVILNIGSLAGERMIEAPIHYCASKAALRGLTQALAKAVSRHRIRVLCLAPGLLEDGVGKSVPPHKLADYLQHCALDRLGTLDEVAELAAFLVSEANSYMSGETIEIAGGV